MKRRSDNAINNVKHKFMFLFSKILSNPSGVDSSGTQPTCVFRRLWCIGVTGGGDKEAMSHPKYLEYLDILGFERRYLKQNTVARLKSNILSPPKI